MKQQDQEPYLDAALRGWIVNTAKRNHWRVAAWYSLEDLIQDGYLAYAKCKARYTFLTVKRHPLPEDKKRFMGLVQAAYANHITNLANARTAGEELALSQIGVEELDAETVSNMLPAQPEEQTLQTLLSTAPAEVVKLITLVLTEGRDEVKFARSRLRRSYADGKLRITVGRRRLRETTNEHFCRRLGLDPRVTNVRESVASYFGLGEHDNGGVTA